MRTNSIGCYVVVSEKTDTMKKIIAIVSAALIVGAIAVSCTSGKKIATVSPRQFEEGVETPGAQVIDVRDAAEYSGGHIGGATNINVADRDFVEKAEKILSKDKPVYLYCRGGRRSLEAADSLVRKGYNVVNLSGGLLSWKSEGLPVVTGDSK